jgi:hypothetical protein
MKRFLLIMMFFLVAAQAGAAPVPKLINYSGKLTDKSGNLIADGDYDMIFTLYDDPTAGTQVWQEAHTATGQLVPVRAGSFNTLLGGITTLPAFDKPYYLELSFKKHSDPAYENFPRQQIVTTPYAMRAEVANQVADNCITSDKIVDKTISTCDIADNTVTAAKIANNTITGAKIATGTITSANVTTSTTAGQRIATANIEDAAITNVKVADGAVDTQAKAPWAPSVSGINNPKIITGSITTPAGGTAHITLSGLTYIATVVVTPMRNDRGFIATVVNVTATGFDLLTRSVSDDTLNACMVFWIAIGN